MELGDPPVDRHRTAALAMTFVLAALALSSATAMPPQPGASGLTDSCQRCHVNGTSSGEAGAFLTLVGVPERYEPGHEYLILVELERGDGPRPHFDILHSFQLGVTAGSLTSANGTLVVIDVREVGSRYATDATLWSVGWTAPLDGDVAFFAEGVVADGDGTEEGDVCLEAWAKSWGPLDVPPEEEVGPYGGRAQFVLLAGLVAVLAGAVLLLTHRKPPLKPED
jgi:hypothetical protein